VPAGNADGVAVDHRGLACDDRRRFVIPAFEIGKEGERTDEAENQNLRTPVDRPSPAPPAPSSSPI
jgi:hypothetical protein